MRLLPDRSKTVGKVLGLRVLNLLLRARGVRNACIVLSENVSLPDMEEIGELRVMHIVEKWRVGEGNVHRTVREVGCP